MSHDLSRPGIEHALVGRRSFLGNAALATAWVAMARRLAIAQAAEASGLAAAWKDAFRIGVAVSDKTLDEGTPAHLQAIAREFSSVTAENAMKWAVIRPDGIQWQWQRADRLVDFAQQHGMHVVGHTLVWHSQIQPSVFNTADGRPLSRDALLGRMRDHIETIVDRYKGRVHAWDVVNEGIDEGNGWRRSPWRNIIGEDFMEQAFRITHAADPAATLLYNDYNMHNPDKRRFLAAVLKDYLDRGVPVNAIGFQGHIGLNYPDLDEWERSIATYAEMGLRIHVTELDLDVLPNPYQQSAEISNRFEYSKDKDPWTNGLPDELLEQQAARYEQVFRILLRHRKSVERVTFWGLHDGISWKNDFPIAGRTNYPLLFDRNLKAKPAWARLMQLARTSV